MDCPLPVVLPMKAENIAAQQKEVISMKKIRTGILAAALLLSIGVTGAFAAGPGWGRHAAWNDNCPASGTSCRYDTDGDGLCDNCGAGSNYVDADGNRLCDNCGANACDCTAGCGRYYADAYNDGVCDHLGDSRCGLGRGMGRGYRR